MGRRKRESLPVEEVEKRLRELLRLEHVEVLKVGGRLWQRHGMAFAVGVGRAVVRGVEVEDYVPLIIRFNPDSLYIAQVVPVDVNVVEPLIELLKGARRLAIKLSTTP